MEDFVRGGGFPVFVECNVSPTDGQTD